MSSKFQLSFDWTQLCIWVLISDDHAKFLKAILPIYSGNNRKSSLELATSLIIMVEKRGASRVRAEHLTSTGHVNTVLVR